MATSIAQRMLNKTDLVKPPQWADEGAGPANYGKTLATNAAFTAPLQKGKLTKENLPEFTPNDFAGKLDNQGVFKNREDNNVVLSGRILNQQISFDLYAWACNTTANGKQGPSNSRTFLFSYFDNSATPKEIFCIFKGCKPVTNGFTANKTDPSMISLKMSVQAYYEVEKPSDSTAWGKVGFSGEPTNTVAFENSGRPLRFGDLGAFHYDTEAVYSGASLKGQPKYNLPWRTVSTDVTWTQRMQDSNGHLTDLYRDYGAREVTGRIGMFKSGPKFNEDARTDMLTVAWLQFNQSGTDIHAKRELGTTHKIGFVAKVPGTLGNDIKIQHVINNNKNSEDSPLIEVRGREIIITSKTGGSSITNMISAIQGDQYASALVAVVGTGTLSTLITAVDASAVALTGGTDGVKKLVFENFKFNTGAEDLLDDTGATIEEKEFRCDTITAKI